MIQAAIDGLTSGGARSTSRGPAPAASSAHFGGEPSYLCEVPGDPQRQRLAASSLAGALASCEAMNELPPGGACRCDEVEDGAALADPLAAR